LTSSPINVVYGPATKLAVYAQPAGTVNAGANFAFEVAATDSFGNINQSFNGPVTVALGTNPGGAALGGTLTVSAVAGIAKFSGLSLNKSGTGYTLTISSGKLTPVTTNPFTVIAIPPTVKNETVVKQYKLNRKGQRQGSPIGWSFELQYSTTMAASAAAKSNYQVYALTVLHGKTTLTQVAFTASYKNNTITLTVTGKNPFVTVGGRITIAASGPNGVRSAAGVLLNAVYTTFTITPGGNAVTLG
jgi:hypothetical protein